MTYSCFTYCSASFVHAGNEVIDVFLDYCVPNLQKAKAVALFELLLAGSIVFSPLNPTDVQLGLGLQIAQATIKLQYYFVLVKFKQLLLNVDGHCHAIT